MLNYTYTSSSPASTLSLGAWIGERLAPGSLLALTGELGCGKTLLTRGICGSLGVPVRQVNSPTFVLVNEYRGRMPVFHLDMYQLGAAFDAVEFGLFDYLARAASGVMIIEWAEKIADVLPEDRLSIVFDILSPRKRRLHFTDTTGKYAALLEGFPR